MIKTVLKIDGMMCGMCESHMNDVVRKSCSPKKVNSSAKNGETVVISEAPLDIPYLKQQIKDMSWFRIRVSRMRKRDFSISDDKRISCLSFCSLCVGKKAPFQKFISFWKSASETVFSIFYP